MPIETMLKELAVTFFISMVPVIELRGAIPVGIAVFKNWLMPATGGVGHIPTV